MSQILLTLPTSNIPLALQADWRATYDQSANQGDPKDLKSGCWRWLWVMAAPSTSLHSVENQAVPTSCSCSVCLHWCPHMNLKEFPDGLTEYLLRKNVFDGKHFFEDWSARKEGRKEANHTRTPEPEDFCMHTYAQCYCGCVAQYS